MNKEIIDFKEDWRMLLMALISIIMYFIRNEFSWLVYSALVLLSIVFVNQIKMLKEKINKLENKK